ncbi:MAG TPA: nitrilase-related carbon-nitrogen hydrolase [Fimbriimonadaceae bacterium]|nr:nitrilase-related carbon-nitrogen hydrolase [Fimbriimonadaceae bacterium]
MRLTLACAQFAPLKAEVSQNLDRIADLARQAHGEGARLVVTPETSTSGYFLEGGVAESAMSSQQLLDEMCARLESLDLDLVVGFYESANGTLHNSAAYLSIPERRVVHVYRKFFLPTYGVFDEERFATRGRELGVFDSRFGRIGLLICEDVWHSIMPALAALKGAQMILVPSASPARGFAGDGIENHNRYRRMLRALCEEHGVYCANCQLTGFEGGKGFIGGSMILDPFGRIVAEGPVGEDHLLLAEIDLDLIGIARVQSPLLPDLHSAWSDLTRIAGEI